MAQPKLKLWTVYKSPSDFPGQFVAREFEADKATEKRFADPQVSKVHQWVFEQAAAAGQGEPFCLPREPGDDPNILHTWL